MTMMSKLVQVTGVHFTDLNVNSYNSNNMKSDLNVSTKQGQVKCS